jgi:hypothetical protein
MTRGIRLVKSELGINSSNSKKDLHLSVRTDKDDYGITIKLARMFWLVLPERIELSTSPFITLMLSHPLCSVCALDHPFIIGFWAVRCRPSGLYTFPSTAKVNRLGSGLPLAKARRFPRIWAVIS